MIKCCIWRHLFLLLHQPESSLKFIHTPYNQNNKFSKKSKFQNIIIIRYHRSCAHIHEKCLFIICFGMSKTEAATHTARLYWQISLDSFVENQVKFVKRKFSYTKLCVCTVYILISKNFFIFFQQKIAKFPNFTSQMFKMNEIHG